MNNEINETSKCAVEKANNVSQTYVTPIVFINESSDGYEVRIELPGTEKEDVELHVENGVLSLKTNSKYSLPEGFRCVRKEFAVSNYKASVQIPKEADLASVAGKFINGVLVVTMAKSEEAKPKKIDIAVS